ncbi:hypothetical protein [Fulvivirga lutea]|uniref:DUF3953 domain-containing protein n=1 Tax=Fulvivirga lutea TaxID=2810512 RepID=A0A974WLC5_9BACT|nr:hypothetical protein [Fulvivirga lutea]QSE98330.1 hypothetical protein JR347_04425 [Fulvivirga lutea]
MKQFNTQYIVAALMLAFSAYQLTLPDYWEFSLYCSAGLAFLVMGLIKEDKLPQYKKALTVLSWILIFLAGFLLLFLARTDV